MKKIIDTISLTIKTHGQKIVDDKRFINILLDYCTDRDLLPYINILRTLVEHHELSPLLTYDADTIQPVIEKEKARICQIYGYDSVKVEKTLYAFVVGAGIISNEKHQSMTMKKQSSKSSASNNVTAQKFPNKTTQNVPPNKNTPPGNNKKMARGEKWKYVGLVAVSFSCLILLPIFYMSMVLYSGYLFWASVFVAILHFVILLFPFALFLEKDTIPKTINNFSQRLSGALVATLFLFVFVFTVGAIIFSVEGLDKIIGFYFHIRSSIASPLSVLVFIIYSYICVVLCKEVLIAYGFTNSASSVLQILSGFYFRQFKFGFIFTVVLYFIILSIAVSYPHLYLFNENRTIKTENKLITETNEKSLKLQNEREKQDVYLSFMDIKLGEDVDSFTKDIFNRSEEYEVKSWKDKRELIVYNVNYQNMFDSCLFVKTIWDNDEIGVDLHIKDNLIMSISFIAKQSIDSILTIYGSKYGEPEYFQTLKKKKSLSDFSYSKDISEKGTDAEEELPIFIVDSLETTDDRPFYDEREDYNLAETYSWTYNNAKILLKNYTGGSYNHVQVIYFDRRIEYRKKELDLQKKVQAEEELRIKQEIKRIQQEEEVRQLEEKRRKEEDNHIKSINQI